MEILIVDDNATSLQSLQLVLSDLGHTPTPFADPVAALKRATEHYFPLIITDIRMPKMDGLTLLKALKSTPETNMSDVIIITGHGDMETAVGALRNGAYDYLNKPINARELAAIVERCAEHQALLKENSDLKQNMSLRVQQATDTIRQDLEHAKQQLRSVAGIGEIVAASPATKRIIEDTKLFHNAPEVPVLIEGETGTGKEIVARLIHFGEGNQPDPFVALNCAAIPPELFESELFGHEEGAFTGSRAGGSSGKLELAGKGTLFLDEIAELPIALQPKLLRVLEERTFYRVGGVKKRNFSARVICAANKKLHSMVEQGEFRRDLYHRLTVGHLAIPPLRERPEDIPPLATLFMHRQAEKKRRKFSSIAKETIIALQQQAWPGNVRELENVIERAVLTHDNSILLPEHLSFLHSSDSTSEIMAICSSLPDYQYKACKGLPLDLENLELPEAPLNLEALTTAIIHKALNRFNGNKSKAAAYLGISRYALHRKLQKP